MQCFLDDCPEPDDDVGGDEVYEPQVRDAAGQVDVEPGVEDHHYCLQGHKDQGEAADSSAGDVIAVRVEVDDEIFYELQEVIYEGPHTKNYCSLSQEAAPVGLDVVVAGGKPGQVEEDVEEEEAGDRVEETQEDVDLCLRKVVKVGVGQLVDCHGDVDRENHQAVQTRERPVSRHQTTTWSAGQTLNN